MKRRGVAALSAAGLVLGLAAVLTPPAQADTDSTLTIVGTSDVSDSHLFLDVLKPGFEAAYPQYTVTYSPSGTQQAINNAKDGLGSALIVHAASLENQFVGEGYSVEPFGRAIFWGDFVLLGPASDPAGIMTSGAPAADPAEAFERLAAVNEDDDASNDSFMVARETGSGTDVQSHQIWAETSGVTTCTVSAANGGGTRPATSSGACVTAPPGDVAASYPDWYRATGVNQAANVTVADLCTTLPGGMTGNDNCYVFTDRGTYQYLAETEAIHNLQIVVRGDSLLLVNSFHAYAINPDKFADDPDVSINEDAALAFLSWVTSSAGQAAVGNYLNDGGDAPFLPSASPSLTVSQAPATVTPGTSITLTGHLSNVVPGTPSLDEVPVRLMATAAVGVAPKQVGLAVTDANGDFSITYTPTESLFYTVTTNQISKVEIATLHPVFGDLLQPSSASAGRTEVVAVPPMTDPNAAAVAQVQKQIKQVKAKIKKAKKAGNSAKVKKLKKKLKKLKKKLKKLKK